MKTINLYEQKNIKVAPKSRNRNTTAYKLFDPACQHRFRVNNVHFRMANKTHDLPIGTSGTKGDLEQVMISMIPTRGTIIEMSDYYRDGAQLGFDDPKIAGIVYKDILTHLDAHLNAMRTDRLYVVPTDDTLIELAEFATAIHAKAIESDPRLDDALFSSSFIDKLSNSRAFISFDKEEIVAETVKKAPKSMDRMNSIEQYLAMIGR